MKLFMSFSVLVLSTALVLLPGQATAAPVSVAFNGSVTGTGYFSHVLTDFPINTSASFNLSFDNSLLTPTLPVTGIDLGAASGQLSLGPNDVWQFDHGQITAYQYQLPGVVDWYLLQFTGTGPSITNNGELFGLFLMVTPGLQLVPGPDSIMVGFGYPTGGGTFYSYALLEGQFSRSGQLPEPASLALVGLSLAGLVFARCRRLS